MIAVLAVLLACGRTWYGRYKAQRIDHTPIAWRKYSPEAVQKELDAGQDVLVLLNFRGSLSDVFAEQQCADTPKLRRMVARGEVTAFRLELTQDSNADGDLSRAMWTKYGVFPAPAVLVYRHERPSEEPWLLRAPFRDTDVIDTLR